MIFGKKKGWYSFGGVVALLVLKIGGPKMPKSVFFVCVEPLLLIKSLEKSLFFTFLFLSNLRM